MKSGCTLLLLLCSLLSAYRASAAPSPFTGLVVTQVAVLDDRGNPVHDHDQLRELIGMKPGDVFSPDAVRNGMALLYLKKTFRDIQVDGFPDQGGVRLVYTLLPITVVDRIVVRGNAALSASEVRDALPNVEGHELREERLAALRSDVTALYEANGYFDSTVTLRSEPLPVPHRVDLVVDIREGDPSLFSDITFPGAAAFSARELRSVMKSRLGAPFRRDLLLDTDRDRILGKYADAGYPAAKLGPVSTGFRDHRVVVSMPVIEGPRVTVRFTGNRAIGTSDLRRALLIWSEHDISDAALDSSVDKIKSLYREQGYADVAVTVKKTESAGVLDLAFAIIEGPHLTVSAIEISGNTAFPTKELKDQMALREPAWSWKLSFLPYWYRSFPFRDDLLEKDADNLRDRYAEAGYLESSVKTDVVRSPDGQKARVLFAITEGKQTKIGIVTIDGATVFTEKQLRDMLALKPGAPFNERLLDEDKYRILSAYSAKGYLFARADVEKTIRDGTADVRFHVTEDRQVRIGRIILRGNESTRDKVIRRELLVKPGDPYDYGKILESQQRIYRLGYFRLAKFEPVHPGESDTQDLLLSVEERPAGSGEVSFGYGDLDRLRGSVELGYRNLWGTAEYSSVRYEQSDILKRAIFNYEKPWFLDRRLDAKFSLIWSDSEKLNSDTREIYYSTRKTAASFGVEKSYEKLKPSLTYQFENVVNYDVLQAAMITSDDSGRVLVSSISPALIYDLRDDVFNPRRGALYGVVLKEALRELGSQADFSKLTVQGGWFFPLGRNVLALDARAGIGWPFRGTPVIPLHERFYVGGSTTVRGYTQDSIGPSAPDASGNQIPQGGESMAVFNIELRINPGEGLGFVLFTDAGNVWSGQELNVASMRASYGGGIRYGTPIGPLRIDYGQKIDRRPGESPGELHFNIGNTF